MALKSTFPHFKNWNVVVALFVVFLCSAVAMFPSQLTVSASAASAALPAASANKQGYVEIRAMKDYGSWIPQNETPTSVLNIIKEIRTATDNETLNLYAIVSGPQASGQFIHGTTMTVDEFLQQAQKEAGGQVIPEIDLNYYTSNINSLALNNDHKFCNPQNTSDCGPSWFYQVSEELIQLTPVASSKNKTIELDAWGQFNRDIVKAGLPADTSTKLLQKLHSEGWQTVIIKAEFYFADGNNVEGVVATVDWSTSSPYMEPETSVLSQYPHSQQGFVEFDRQIMNPPFGPTALYEFLAVLTPSQQAIALKNLASLQNKDDYTFIYPVITYTQRNDKTVFWDAAKNVQSNGQPFLNLIENLLVSDGPSF